MIEPRYTSLGKEVLHKGRHLADARSVETAALIAHALELGANRAVNAVLRKIIVTRLTHAAAIQDSIAASISDPADGKMRQIFISAAEAMRAAIKELSDG